jgi:hypothetical protein
MVSRAMARAFLVSFIQFFMVFRFLSLIRPVYIGRPQRL